MSARIELVRCEISRPAVKWALTFRRDRVDRESTPRENCVCDKKKEKKGKGKKKTKRNETVSILRFFLLRFTDRVHRSMNFEPPMNFYSRLSPTRKQEPIGKHRGNVFPP